MGTRGIPARYGGFETFYENLGPGLADRGHDVTVYARSHAIGPFEGERYRGVRVVTLPSIRTKHLETISHSLASVLHGLPRRYDVVYVCGVGNAPLAWLPRLARARVVLNVDSADWRRKKWGRLAAFYLRSTERLAGRCANLLVADSRVIQERYRADYGATVAFFPYGARRVTEAGTATIEKFGLRRRRYFLWVGRLEPETRVEDLIRAYTALGTTGHRLVIVGAAPYADAYRRFLEGIAGPGVVFTGGQYGEAYRELSFHADAYVQTSPTSGTSPALLDQMAAGGAVITLATPTNLEVIGDAGLAYTTEADGPRSLERALRRALDDPELMDRLRAAAHERVETIYSWDRIIDDYDRLFADLTEARRPRARAAQE